MTFTRQICGCSGVCRTFHKMRLAVETEQRLSDAWTKAQEERRLAIAAYVEHVDQQAAKEAA